MAGVVELLTQLGGQLRDDRTLWLGEVKPVPAVRLAHDARSLPEHALQASCCIVAHRPWACRRDTSNSAFSFVPLETIALPR